MTYLPLFPSRQHATPAFLSVPTVCAYFLPFHFTNTHMLSSPSNKHALPASFFILTRIIETSKLPTYLYVLPSASSYLGSKHAVTTCFPPFPPSHKHPYCPLLLTSLFRFHPRCLMSPFSSHQRMHSLHPSNTCVLSYSPFCPHMSPVVLPVSSSLYFSLFSSQQRSSNIRFLPLSLPFHPRPSIH